MSQLDTRMQAWKRPDRKTKWCLREARHPQPEPQTLNPRVNQTPDARNPENLHPAPGVETTGPQKHVVAPRNTGLLRCGMMVAWCYVGIHALPNTSLNQWSSEMQSRSGSNRIGRPSGGSYKRRRPPTSFNTTWLSITLTPTGVPGS